MSRSAFALSGLSRRAFLTWAGGGTVGLIFGVDAVGRIIAELAPTGARELAPNQWIRIDQNGRVIIRAHKSEMGQGVRTALPAVVAAELGADWSSVRVVHAEPGPDFPDMATSGSSSVPDSWLALRRAAAAARAVLIAAAAKRWGVRPEDCDARYGYVVRRAGALGAKRRAANSGTANRVGFGELVADAALVRVPRDAPLRPDSELSILGTRLRHVDTPAIVRGRATYGIDVRVPGMLFAVIARPPNADAEPRVWNEEAARRVPGVERVVRVSRGIAVVARNSWAALQGRTALAVEWTGPADSAQTSALFVERLDHALSNGKVARREGDIAQGMTAAATRMTAVYRAPFQAHAAIEPLTCVADVTSDRCEIWVGTQRPNQVKQAAMDMLGLAREAVSVHVTLIGGAFGRRIAIDHAREAIELSHVIKSPVQVLWSREDDFSHDMYQPAQVNRLTAGLDPAGTVVAWKHEVSDYHLSMFGAFDPNADPKRDGDPWGGFDSPYVFPAFECTQSVLEAPVPTGAWRSVSYPAAVFARECFLDEVAHATHRDPLELRLALIPSPGNIQTRRGPRPNGDRLRNVLRLAAERAGWGKSTTDRRDGRRRGQGIACNPYDQSAMVAQVADVSVGPDNDVRVHRVVTAIDVGRVIDRSSLEAQVEGGVAWALSATLKTEITFAGGRAQQTTFGKFPVLRMREMPAQDIVIVDNDLGPFGAGEPPVPAVFAAVGNAVFAATGVRLRETPLRLG